jgi:DNA repair exonuclease SbcCD ATPase subunit
MESHAKEQGCGGLRALGTVALIVSTLFAFVCGGPAAYGQAGWEQPAAPPDPPAGPAEPVQGQLNDLNQRRDELAQKAHQQESELRELAQDTNARRERILADLRQIHDQMCGVEKDLVRLDEQCRQRLEGQIARAQNRARGLAEQVEKLRAETREVQAQMEQARARSRREAEQIASALEQTRRQIRITEDRLNGPEIRYQPRVEPPIPNPPLPPEGRPSPEMQVAPRPGVPQPIRRIRPGPGEAVRDLQQEIRRLRIEMQGTRESVQELASRPEPAGPNVANGLEQLRVKLDAVQQQVQQTQEAVERQARMDNPYCVGSAGGRLYPNRLW